MRIRSIHVIKKILLISLLALILMNSINVIAFQIVVNTSDPQDYGELTENHTFATDASGWTIVKGSAVHIDSGLDIGALKIIPQYVSDSGKYVFKAESSLKSVFLNWLNKGYYKYISFTYFFKLTSSTSTYVSAYAFIEYTFPASGGGGGCPFVAIYDGNKYVLVNNILPSAELYKNLMWVHDHVLIDTPVFAGKIVKLKIIEFEKEMSFINYIRLFSFDYPPQYRVAQLSNDMPILWDPHKVLLPSKVINSTGHLVSGKVVWDDQLPYVGRKGDALIITFNNVNKSYNLLIIKADLKTIFSIKIYVFKNNSWILIDTIRPRAFYSWFAVNLTPYITTSQQKLQIKMEFTANHKIDFLALSQDAGIPIKLREVKLISAIHTRYGKCTSLLRRVDNKFVVIMPGDELYLTFKDKKLLQNLKRSYLLEVVGWYKTLHRKILSKYIRRILTLDPTAGVSSPEIRVKDAGIWVKVPVDLCISRSDIQSIKFVIYIVSPVRFEGVIDLAISYFEMKTVASSSYGDVQLVVLVKRVDNVEEMNTTAQISLAVSLVARPISDDYGTRWLEINVTKSDSSSESAYAGGEHHENVKITNVGDIMAYDSALGEIAAGAEYIERAKYKEDLEALIDSISLGLSGIGLGLTTAAALASGTTAAVLGAVSFVLDVASFVAYFIPQYIGEANRLVIYTLDTDAFDDNLVRISYSTWYYCYSDEGSAVTQACSLNVPIEWTCIIVKGSNTIYIDAGAWFGKIVESWSGNKKVLQICAPYSIAHARMSIKAILL